MIGPSGSGKSHSLKTLNPATTVIICCDKKALPFKGSRLLYQTIKDDKNQVDRKKSNYFEVSSPTTVIDILKFVNTERPEVKVIVIDTITIMMVDDYASRMSIDGWQKFTDIAVNYNNVKNTIKSLRANLFVIVMAHQEVTYDELGNKQVSFKVAAGKLVKEKIEIEARFTTVLYAGTSYADNKTDYFFETQTNGSNTCKSPEGMFPDRKIPNDIKYVIQCVNAYNLGKDVPALPEGSKPSPEKAQLEEKKTDPNDFD